MDIVILGYRVSGTDGVSLETEHWVEILKRMGHSVRIVAGELDREGILIPELHFKWAPIAKIHDDVVYGTSTFSKIEKKIDKLSVQIEKKLLKKFFNGSFSCDVLIVPNVFSLPMNFPLAVALTKIIREKNIPTLARHHDFWWERSRYLNASLFEFFEKYFPPHLPTIKHTVINSIAQYDLKKREGLESRILSDSFDFNSKINEVDDYSKMWRRDFGIREDDIVFLQATRIVPRKRIELSIDLIHKLKNPKAILVLAGYEGDEAEGYLDMLIKRIKDTGIRAIHIGDRVDAGRKIVGGKKVYTLWDCFVNADFMTYPTQIEGFGNQFVESTFFKKLAIVTPYPVFKSDIAPKGFEFISMPEKVTDTVINEIKNLIKNPISKHKKEEKNFRLGKKYFSYEATEEKLQSIFDEMKLH